MTVQQPEISVEFDADAAFWANEGWYAFQGDYDLDCIVGHGRTPLDAIVDLLDKLEG